MAETFIPVLHFPINCDVDSRGAVHNVSKVDMSKQSLGMKKENVRVSIENCLLSKRRESANTDQSQPESLKAKSRQAFKI